jgi:purine-binding chemotaxis protein CheW
MTLAYEAPAVEMAADARSTGQFVAFTCAGQGFGIDIMAVREIRSWSAVTPLPAAKADMLGVLDIRGEVVPIYDLARRIGCAGTGEPEPACQVILVVSLPGRDIGLVVDGVSDIVTVEPQDMRPVPRLEGATANFVSGMVEAAHRLVAILDPQQIFATAEEEMEFAYLD